MSNPYCFDPTKFLVMTEPSVSRIKFAYFHRTWDAKQSPWTDLLKSAKSVAPQDYSSDMRGRLYCPGCRQPLARTPEAKAVFSNGRKACFSHFPTSQPIPCELRSTKPEGMLFTTEEEAKQAIASNELVVISAFLNEPAVPIVPAGPYDQTPVEDVAGPLSDLPISRHSGQTFRLPSKLSTIEALCRRFDANLYRYFVFPGSKSAVRLIDALRDVRTVVEHTESEALYFGLIIDSFVAGQVARPTHLRMTKLACNGAVKDFYVKVVDRVQTQKGISNDSMGRYVLFWGKIGINGIGLCAERLAWGEFALLPQKYEDFLPSIQP